MEDRYSRGAPEDWWQQSNSELGRALKRASLKLSLSLVLNVVMALALAWTVYQYSQVAPIESLWSPPAPGEGADTP